MTLIKQNKATLDHIVYTIDKAQVAELALEHL